MARKRQASAHSEVYEFTITLRYIDPPIWRRVQVPDQTLDDFHFCIQDVFGWDNDHLHDFLINRRRYADPSLLDSTFDEEEMGDTLRVRLGEILERRRKGFRFRYLYDFGDSWEHEIRYEGRRPADPEVRYPVCVDGARACPPEDCGGPWGYHGVLEALAHPEDGEYADLREWLGEYDPEAFSAEAATRRLHRESTNEL